MGRSAAEFCAAVPKVELHAHLNGSIRPATLLELAGKAADAKAKAAAHALVERGLRNAAGSLPECFEAFGAIHAVASDPSSVERVAREAVEDFANDNVVYAEIRTTPKHRPEHGMTKRSYVEAVLRGVSAATGGRNDGSGPITVRLLLSIDRREGDGAARETVEVAKRFADRGVVGIDLSGNPQVGELRTWVPALAMAASYGLRITLHCGEVVAPLEAAEMIRIAREWKGRLGHCTTCATDRALLKQLLASRVPVEACITSNLVSRTVKSARTHHARALLRAGHPVTLCTDDSGVFSTTMSHELELAMRAFRLSEREVFDVARQGVEHAFCSAGTRLLLERKFERERARLCPRRHGPLRALCSRRAAAVLGANVALRLARALVLPGRKEEERQPAPEPEPVVVLQDTVAKL